MGVPIIFYAGSQLYIIVTDVAETLIAKIRPPIKKIEKFESGLQVRKN